MGKRARESHHVDSTPLKIRIKLPPPQDAPESVEHVQGYQIRTSEKLKRIMFSVLHHLMRKDQYHLFEQPIDPEAAPDYAKVIKTPVFFSLIREKILSNKYRTLQDFQEDLHLLCANAMKYNSEETIYYKEARRLLLLSQTILRIFATKTIPELCGTLLSLEDLPKQTPYSAPVSKLQELRSSLLKSQHLAPQALPSKPPPIEDVQKPSFSDIRKLSFISTNHSFFSVSQMK